MLTIDDNTEKRLFDDLKYLKREQPNTRCLYLRFSKLTQNYITWRPLLVEIIRKHFSEDVMDIYFCKDRDVFITSKSFTQKHTRSLIDHLKAKINHSELEKLISIFQVQIDWVKLERLCEIKAQNARNIELGVERQIIQKEYKPATIVEEAAPDLVKTIQARRAERKELKIMAVEDDFFSQTLLRSAIGSKYDQLNSLRICNDGESAIPAYIKDAPDILFLDIGLPGMSGHTVLAKIHEIDPEAYIVMFSGNGDKQNITRAINMGAKSFIGKPFTKNKIFKCIENSPHICAKTRELMKELSPQTSAQ